MRESIKFDNKGRITDVIGVGYAREYQTNKKE